MPEEHLLTTEDVAAWLKLSRVTVWRKVREGEIPALKPGKNYRFRRQDIEAYLARYAVRPETKRVPDA